VSIRLGLSLGLSLATLMLAVATAGVQSHNRSEAARLDEQLSTIKLIEAVNDERSAEIVARDYAPPHKQVLKPAPKPVQAAAPKTQAKTAAKPVVAPVVAPVAKRGVL